MRDDLVLNYATIRGQIRTRRQLELAVHTGLRDALAELAIVPEPRTTLERVAFAALLAHAIIDLDTNDTLSVIGAAQTGCRDELQLTSWANGATQHRSYK